MSRFKSMNPPLPISLGGGGMGPSARSAPRMEAPSATMPRPAAAPVSMPVRMPASMPASMGAESGISRFGLSVVAFFLFVVVSRLPEVLANLVGTSFKIAILSLLIAGVIAILSGRLFQTLFQPTSLAILGFTAWCVICIPFSVWKGGSFAIIKGTWLISLAAFLIVATMPAVERHLRPYAGALAWATILNIVVLLKFGTVQDSRGKLEIQSSLSNPNIMALQLLLGLPFLIYWVRTRGFVSWRGILGVGASVGVAVLIVLRTGSRSGLIAMSIIGLILLAGMKVHVRIGIVATLLLGSVAVIPFIPDYLIYRYATLLNQEEDDTSEAAESSRARKQHLKESLILTMQKPLFGVGPGQFQVASADLAKNENRRALWRETHNSFTQVSSETGIPGTVLYLAMILAGLMPVWSDLRRANRAKTLLPRHEFAGALLISATGLFVTSNFSSLAYQYYWPIMCGMGLAYQQVARAENARLMAAGINRGLSNRSVPPNSIPLPRR